MTSTHQTLGELLKDSETTIKEYSIFMIKNTDLDQDSDFKIMNKASERIKSFDDAKRLLTMGIHYRNSKNHIKKLVEIFSTIKIEYEVWSALLTYDDPWYLKVSEELETIIIQRSFETVPIEEISTIYNYCFKKSTASRERMRIAISQANIPKEKWSIIGKISSDAEIKKISEEKISQT
jgi:hypothetical protein